jgi:serine/threonine protein phosphatase PrpC
LGYSKTHELAKLIQNKKLENMAKIIVETAKEKGSEDNISCIIIELNKKLHVNK